MRLRQRTGPKRCAYCHDQIKQGEGACVCRGSHVDCAELSNGCLVCGAAPSEAVVPLWARLVRASEFSEEERAAIEEASAILKKSLLCECGNAVLMKGEFRCYDCWNVDEDMAFGIHTKGPFGGPEFLMLGAIMAAAIAAVLTTIFG